MNRDFEESKQNGLEIWEKVKNAFHTTNEIMVPTKTINKNSTTSWTQVSPEVSEEQSQIWTSYGGGPAQKMTTN